MTKEIRSPQMLIILSKWEPEIDDYSVWKETQNEYIQTKKKMLGYFCAQLVKIKSPMRETKLVWSQIDKGKTDF